MALEGPKQGYVYNDGMYILPVQPIYKDLMIIVAAEPACLWDTKGGVDGVSVLQGQIVARVFVLSFPRSFLNYI